MNSSLVKTIINLLPDNLEIEVIKEGVLITGVNGIEGLHKEVTPTPETSSVSTSVVPTTEEFCKTTKEPEKVAFIVPTSIRKLLIDLPEHIVNILCKEYITEVSKYWSSTRKNNIDIIRKMTNKNRPSLNSKMLLAAKYYAIANTEVDSMENKLIILNIPILKTLCKS